MGISTLVAPIFIPLDNYLSFGREQENFAYRWAWF